jgi:flagellin
MSRINTNVTSLIAQRVLRKNNDSLNVSLERLSTGLKINRGADNPAGLIASENLRAEKAGLSQAINNAQRASNIIGTAEGGLSEVSSLLTELAGLVNEAANKGGLSNEEVEANQLQVDSILSTINRIADSTSFQGIKLLNGNYAYSTTDVDSTKIANVRVNSARLPDSAPMNVVVSVTQSAQTAQIAYSGGALAANNAVTVSISGNKGTEQISFAGGTTVGQMVTAINAVKNATGVSAATASAGTQLVLNSTEFGSDQYVSLATISGTFAPDSSSDYGRNAAVKVNGATAEAKGLSISFRSSNLDVEIDLKNALNINNAISNFVIAGGGATFALGSKVTENDKAAIGIAAMTTASLGDNTLGFLSTLGSGKANSLSSDNLVNAQKIVDKAIKQVSQQRGRLGAFQKFTIGSTVNSLSVALENASAAESAIRDTDFAEETANMTRSQILAQAGTTVLAQANASPQAALALLR